MSNKVKCDNEECSKEFNISLQTIRLDDGIEKTFFVCPRCKTEYTVIYTSEETRFIQFKMNKTLKEFNKAKKKYLSSKKEDTEQLKKLEEKWTNYMDLMHLHKRLIEDLKVRIS